MEDRDAAEKPDRRDVSSRPLRPVSSDPTLAMPASAPPPVTPVSEWTQVLPASPQPPTGPVSADALLADAQRRRSLEQELGRLGMSPDEVRRLLNADANSTSAPLPAVPTSSRNAASSSAGSLSAFAAQLMSARAAAQVDAIEHVDLALPEFRESTFQEARQAEQILRDAAMLRRREHYKEAIAKCREALTLAPKDGAALELLGDLLQGIARTDEALAAYKRAVDADPKRSSAERKYGELLVQQQQWNRSDPEAVPKKRLFATLLSLVMPGLGQFHNGEIGKGVFFLVADVICFCLLTLSPWGFSGEQHRHSLNTGLILCLVATVIVYLAALVDANARARQGGGRRGGASGWDT